MANKDKNKTASVNETMKNLIDSEYAQMKKEGKIPKDEQVFKKTEPQYTTSKPVITSSPKRNSKQVQTQEKDEDKEKKKRKGLVLGLCLGLGIPIIAGLTASTIYFALNGGSGKQYVTTITEKSCEGAGTFDNNIWTLNGNAETSTVTFTTDSSIPVDKQEWTLSNAIDGEEVSFAGLMLTNPTADTPATITATVGDIYEKEIVYIQLRDKSTTPSTIVSYLKIQVLPIVAIVPKNTTISGNETITLTSGADAEHATTKQTYNITLYSEAGTVLTDWNTFWSYKIPENLPSGVKITFTPDKTDTRKGELEIDVQNAHLPSDQTITVTLNGYTQGYITESQTKTITINVLTDYKINRTIVSNLNPEVQELNLVAGSVRNDTADFKCQFATYDGRILDPGTNKADWSCGVVSGTAPTGFSLDIQPDVNDPNQSKLTVNASECVNDQETRITIRVYADVKHQPLQVSNIGHYDINIVIEPIGTKNQIVYNGTPVEIQTPIDLNAFCEPNAGDWEIPTDDQGNKIKIEDKSLLTQINVIAHTSGTTLGNNFLKDCTGLTTVNLNSLNDIDHVGDDFMSGCTNINHLDLSGLSGVTTIGSSFLANCNGFTKPVDFSPLANVTTIGDKFLLNTDLSTIDLSSMTSLTTTGDNFLNGCTNLTSFNLSPLVSLQTIGNHFMDGCSSLKYCNFGTDLDKVTAIGTHFFNGCSELQFVNLGGLTNISLTIDGYYFLYD